MSFIQIKKKFNRAAETYDHHCRVQRLVCEELIFYLQQQGCNSSFIGDYACGTGVSTHCLASHFSYRHLYAIDVADQLLNKAKLKFQSTAITWVLSDFDLPCVPAERLTLAFSNMGLQWSPCLEHTIATLASQLQAEGTLAFSLPLPGTFEEIQAYARNTFLESQTILMYLKNQGFSSLFFRESSFIEKFDSMRAALQSIRGVGANGVLASHAREGLGALSMLRKQLHFVETAQLTYRIGYFIAKK